MTWCGQSLEERTRWASDQDVGCQQQPPASSDAAARVTGSLSAGLASPHATLHSLNPLDVTFRILQMRKPRAKEVLCPRPHSC